MNVEKMFSYLPQTTWQKQTKKQKQTQKTKQNKPKWNSCSLKTAKSLDSTIAFLRGDKK